MDGVIKQVLIFGLIVFAVMFGIIWKFDRGNRFAKYASLALGGTAVFMVGGLILKGFNPYVVNQDKLESLKFMLGTGALFITPSYLMLGHKLKEGKTHEQVLWVAGAFVIGFIYWHCLPALI